MKKSWKFTLPKVALLYLCGVLLGGDLFTLLIPKLPFIGPLLGALSMILISSAILISCRVIEQPVQKKKKRR